MSELDNLEKKYGFKIDADDEILKRIILNSTKKQTSPTEKVQKQIIDKPRLIEKEGDHRSCFPPETAESGASEKALGSPSSRYLDNGILVLFDEADIEAMEKSPAKNLARFIKYRRQK